MTYKPDYPDSNRKYDQNTCMWLFNIEVTALYEFWNHETRYDVAIANLQTCQRSGFKHDLMNIDLENRNAVKLWIVLNKSDLIKKFFCQNLSYRNNFKYTFDGDMTEKILKMLGDGENT